MSIAIGAAVILIGLGAIAGWWRDFITVLKGSVPLVLIFCGTIALIAGLAAMNDERSSHKK